MGRLLLAPLVEEDVDCVMMWVNDPEVVKNFQNFSPISREQELAFIRKLRASPNDKVFSMWRRYDYVGQTAINQISWQNRLGRLALMIRREYWNMGYAKEVIPLVLRIAFDELQLHKVWLMSYAGNQKGRRLWTKLGFKEEAYLREEYFWQGAYHDIVRMGMLEGEYRELYGSA